MCYCVYLSTANGNQLRKIKNDLQKINMDLNVIIIDSIKGKDKK